MFDIFISSVHLLCFFWGHQSTYTKYHIYLGSHKGLCCLCSILLGIVRNSFLQVGFVLLLSVTFCQLLQAYCPRSFFTFQTFQTMLRFAIGITSKQDRLSNTPYFLCRALPNLCVFLDLMYFFVLPACLFHQCGIVSGIVCVVIG